MTGPREGGPSRTDEVQAAVAQAFEAEWGRVLATVIRTTGDWELSEDCTQEAFAEAVRRWAADGIPDRPGAWLTTVARNRAIDRIRRRATESAKLEEVARSVPDEESGYPLDE